MVSVCSSVYPWETIHFWTLNFFTVNWFCDRKINTFVFMKCCREKKKALFLSRQISNNGTSIYIRSCHFVVCTVICRGVFTFNFSFVIKSMSLTCFFEYHLIIRIIWNNSFDIPTRGEKSSGGRMPSNTWNFCSKLKF